MPVLNRSSTMATNLDLASPNIATLSNSNTGLDSAGSNHLNYQNSTTRHHSVNSTITTSLPILNGSPSTNINHNTGNIVYNNSNQSGISTHKSFEVNANTSNTLNGNGGSVVGISSPPPLSVINTNSILNPLQQLIHSSRDDVTSLGGVSSINSQLSSVNSQNNNNIDDNFNSSRNIIKGSQDNLLNAYYNVDGNSVGGSENGGRESTLSRNHCGEDPGDGLGALPPKWETAYTERGELYFIDHNTGTSHWLDPRLSKYQKKSLEDCGEDELPYGWEKIEDSLYGTYYIDHVNRKTQYENPVLEAKRRAAEQKQNERLHIRPPTPSNQSNILTVTAGGTSSTASTVDIAHRSMHPPPPEVSNKFYLPYKFTRNPAEMQGERFTTTLIKSARGLGITIVGGESLEGAEEFLQIKSIVPNGPAWLDNKLQTGDILVYVNDTCVLGLTHHEMVNVFQSIMAGDTVTLEVCRGYSLPFDPNDPNTEVVTTIAVDGISSEPSKQRHMLMEATKNDKFSILDATSQNSNKLSGNLDSSGFILMKKPEVFTLTIIKGTMGFGFTIADSAEGQKVKKILDRNCCAQLLEGDVLLNINDINVRYKTHNEVVQILKECSKSEPTVVKIQRSLKSSNAVVNTTLYDEKVVGNVAKLRKNFATNAGLYRSKTPTADLYSTQQKEILPMRPKTPLVDTRRMRVNTPNHELSDDAEVAAAIRNNSKDNLDRNLEESKSQVDGKSNNSLHDIDIINQEIPFMDPFPKLVSSLSERLASSKLNDTMGGETRSKFQNDYINDGNYTAIYSVSPYVSTINPINPLHQQQMPSSHDNYLPRNTFSSINPVTSSTFSYQPHHESCFCYSCQDVQAANNYRSPVGQQMQQHTFYGQSELSLPLAGNSHTDCPQYSTAIGSIQAAHLQNERMQKRVNELLNDRRCVGLPTIENHKQTHNRNIVYNQTKLNQDMPPQQLSPAISSISQQTSLNWGPTYNTSVSTNPDLRNALLDIGETAEQYELNEVTLERQALGFGFRIVGGTEEGSQVTVGHIVPNGAADNDHRINTGDEILSIDGVNVVNSSHHKVVSLMGEAALRGQVTMILRRRLQIPHIVQHNINQAIPTASTVIHYPYDIVVSRNENEGFGFVIISSSNQFYGSTIGKLIPDSPADRCGVLKVGDRIVAVNRIEIAGMSHGDVVNLIKESGLHVRLTIGYPIKEFSSVSQGRTTTPSILNSSQGSPSGNSHAPSNHLTQFSHELSSSNTKQQLNQNETHSTPIERSTSNVCAATTTLINHHHQPQQL